MFLQAIQNTFTVFPCSSLSNINNTFFILQAF